MNRRLGIAILILVVVVVVGYQFLRKNGAPGALGGGGGPAVTVKGLIGGEKSGLLRDEQVGKILQQRHGLTLDTSRAGSIDMVRGSTTGQDFLWPSSQIALELFQGRGGQAARAEVLLNSPMVLYSRQVVTDALMKLGIVQKVGEAYYVIDFPKLIRLINEGKQWKEIGLPQLYGRVTIFSTDPTRSNSGNMFAGLLANMVNKGEVVDEASLPATLPTVKRFFGRLGYMQHSSGDLFTQFLQQGVGSYPIIVGYEAQLIEFGEEHPEYRDTLRKEITTLYPRPTVWSSHPLIALTQNGTRLLTALQDEQIQRLAWEKHGFRSGIAGVPNDPKALHVGGVPATIENVMPLPKAQVMQRIIQALSGS